MLVEHDYMFNGISKVTGNEIWFHIKAIIIKFVYKVHTIPLIFIFVITNINPIFNPVNDPVLIVI